MRSALSQAEASRAEASRAEASRAAESRTQHFQLQSHAESRGVLRKAPPAEAVQTEAVGEESRIEMSLCIFVAFDKSYVCIDRSVPSQAHTTSHHDPAGAERISSAIDFRC